MSLLEDIKAEWVWWGPEPGVEGRGRLEKEFSESRPNGPVNRITSSASALLRFSTSVSSALSAHFTLQ